MKQLKWFLLVFVAAMGVFSLTSCADDLIAADAVEYDEMAFVRSTDSASDDIIAIASSSSEARRGACFEITFPITLQYPDKSTVEVSSKEELRETNKAWVESVLGEGGKLRDLSEDQRLKFVFPIEVTKDGETSSIDTEEAFKELMQECPRRGKGQRGRRGHKGPRGRGCVEFVFPLSVTMPDGTQINATDKENLREQTKAWKEANPEAEGRPEFVFPIEVTKKDGTTATATDADQLKELMTECRGERGLRCFTLVYPVSMVLPDGSTISGDSHRDLKQKLKAWSDENGRPETRPELVYPVTVTLQDESTQQINSKEDFETLKESCSNS